MSKLFATHQGEILLTEYWALLIDCLQAWRLPFASIPGALQWRRCFAPAQCLLPFAGNRIYNMTMEITFDSAKNERNIRERGLSFLSWQRSSTLKTQ